MILTGKGERAAKALRLGLVDEVVPRSILAAPRSPPPTGSPRDGLPEARAQGRRAGPAARPNGRRAGGWSIATAREQVLKRTGGHYPAPLAALEVVRVGLEHGITAGLSEEHRTFGELAVGDVSRKLVQIFFATTALKKDDGIPPGSADPAAGPPTRHRGRGLHGRGHRGHGGAQGRSGHPAQGRGADPGGEGTACGDQRFSPSGSSAGGSPARSSSDSAACSPDRPTTADSAAPIS